MLNNYTGIMFDMDNTILSSKIDFKKMKQNCTSVLDKYGIEQYKELGEHSTPAQLLELGKEYERNYGEKGIVVEMLMLIELCEKEGMEDAHLEQGAMEVLQSLASDKTIIVVTNNATSASIYALNQLRVLSLFKEVYGRDKMRALKPSPESIKSVLELYPSIPKSNWVMIGDSWIDGKAATDAGIDFIGYKCDTHLLVEKGVKPIGIINHLSELMNDVKND